MRKKEKGSTLITTIIVISLIGVMGAAVLSLCIGDYRLKINESERLKNLYAADSGIDTAYDILAADFDMAGNFAKFKVDAMKAGNAGTDNPNVQSYDELTKNEKKIKEKKELSAEEMTRQLKQNQKEIDKVINAEFKRNFKLFLFGNGEYVNKYDGDYVPDMLTDSIRDLKYPVKMCQGGRSDGDSLNPESDKVSKSDFYMNPVALANKPNLDVTVYSNDKDKDEKKDYDYDRKQTFAITITSTFETNKVDKAGINDSPKNRKEIQARYNLIIPNYGDILFTRQDYKGNDYYTYDDKAITVFGNMQVKDMGNSNLDVNGDVFVEGNKNLLKLNGEPMINGDDVSEPLNDPLSSDASTSHITDKYHGGITLGSGGGNTGISMNGNVVTRKTFNLSQNVSTVITKNLYADNVYAGMPNGKTGNSINLTLNSGKDNSDTEVILNNDLTLKAENSHIGIDNFYGVNNKNNKNDNDNDKENRSSSIIVNTIDDNNSIVINKKAYIMGVAFVDTADSYQTGESVAVRGNYKAYLNDGSNNINDGSKIDVDINEKSNHFVEYWNRDIADLKDGGVKFNSPDDVYTFGARVYDKKVTANNKKSYDEISDEIQSKKRNYAVNVGNLGQELDNAAEEDNLYDTISRKSETTESDIVKDKFFNINAIDKDTVQINNAEVQGVFNKSAAKNVVIQGGGDHKYDVKSDDIVVPVDKNGNVSAFIATSGNVIIDGNIHFSGNIIAGGNLIICGNEDKTITYDSNASQKIQEKDPDIFESVFQEKLDNQSETNRTEESGSLKIDYDLSKFLKQALWQLKK